jgi:hypothetical protein
VGSIKWMKIAEALDKATLSSGMPLEAIAALSEICPQYNASVIVQPLALLQESCQRGPVEVARSAANVARSVMDNPVLADLLEKLADSLAAASRSASTADQGPPTGMADAVQLLATVLASDPRKAAEAQRLDGLGGLLKGAEVIGRLQRTGQLDKLPLEARRLGDAVADALVRPEAYIGKFLERSVAGAVQLGRSEVLTGARAA